MKTDRELYIEHLNKGSLNIEIAYSYFSNKGGTVSREEFYHFVELLPNLTHNIIGTLNKHFNVVLMIEGDKVIRYY